MTKLALDGGPKVFEEPIKFIPWPPVYPETAEKLKEIYLGHRWSFYGAEELKFDDEFAAYTGAKHCILMANGTVTLQSALEALGIGPGDEVIIPAFTWLATGTAVVDAGATPVIVDIDPESFCIDVKAAEAAITPRTRAIIPVHLFAAMADMDAVMALAHKYNLKVIEDCAHAHGSFWNGKHAGSIGDVGSFSFQESKTLASGEGGACITNDDHLAELIGRISHIGYPKAAKQGAKYTAPPMGLTCHNFRVTDFQAAILSGQLKHLQEDTLLRERNMEYLRKNIDAIPGIKCQKRCAQVTQLGVYHFAMHVDLDMLKPGITNKELSEAFAAEGIGFGPGWGHPVYRQNLWSVASSKYRVESSEVAEELIYKRLLSCALQILHCPQETLDKVIECVDKVMAAYRR